MPLQQTAEPPDLCSFFAVVVVSNMRQDSPLSRVH